MESHCDIPQLIAQAKSANAAAKSELFERYRAYLSYLAEKAIGPALRRRCDPADVVQETYTAATRGFASFDGRTEPEFSAWISTILRTEIANAVRHHTAKARDWQRECHVINTDGSATISWFQPVAKDSTPSQQFIYGENALKLLKALGTLPEEQRIAVRMRYLEGEKLSTIAERLKRTPGAAAGLIRRGLSALRRTIGSEVVP